MSHVVSPPCLPMHKIPKTLKSFPRALLHVDSSRTCPRIRPRTLVQLSFKQEPCNCFAARTPLNVVGGQAEQFLASACCKDCPAPKAGELAQWQTTTKGLLCLPQLPDFSRGLSATEFNRFIKDWLHGSSNLKIYPLIFSLKRLPTSTKHFGNPSKANTLFGRK